jgi:cell division protein FtsW (lipid II flippase)
MDRRTWVRSWRGARESWLLAAKERAAAVRQLSPAIFAPALVACLVGAIGLRAMAGPMARRVMAMQLVWVVLGLVVVVLMAGRWRTVGLTPARIAASAAVVLSASLLLFGRSYSGFELWLSVGSLTVMPGEACKPLLVLAAAGIALPGRPHRALDLALVLSLVGGPLALGADPVGVGVLASITVSALVVRRGRTGEVVLPAAVGIALFALAFAMRGSLEHGVLPGQAGSSRSAAEIGLATIAQHAGPAGLVFVVGILGAIVVALVRIVRSTTDPGSRVIAVGVTVAFLAELVGRIALGDGLVFFSYGGSSVVCTLALLTLVTRPAVVGHRGRYRTPGCGLVEADS